MRRTVNQVTGAGRFAPTPTSPLHLGNLRTAVAAYLAARHSGRQFHWRVDDLDRDRIQAARGIAEGQLDDLTRLGLTHDGPVLYQSDRELAYQTALDQLSDRVYECFCSRREIALAAQAPHASDGLRPYPGTCRQLSTADREQLRQERPPALRIRTDDVVYWLTDRLAGPIDQPIDDFVIRRSDGIFAYNFAVVVDDAYQRVDQVVRGDDLLSSTPRQAWLAEQLGLPVPDYAHLPLVVGPDGTRLAKRDGAISLDRLINQGWTVPRLLGLIGQSLGLTSADETDLAALTDQFDWDRIPLKPWVLPPELVAGN
ncbi:MAG: tRNA glutamyl-Q(34) synthetase GluQRS [Propionibacteriaceae bacterium]|jgi:glutamyl-tRNA synthetase|nr:tRNA glutamyl-Q(34) synthetase GluQRS [Propionibacteriaceae bacterium]